MPQIQLVITLDTESGSVGVSGPIDNKMLTYGLLELARDAVNEHNQQKGPQRIIPATLAGLPRVQ